MLPFCGEIKLCNVCISHIVLLIHKPLSVTCTAKTLLQPAPSCRRLRYNVIVSLYCRRLIRARSGNRVTIPRERAPLKCTVPISLATALSAPIMLSSAELVNSGNIVILWLEKKCSFVCTNSRLQALSDEFFPVIFTGATPR